MSGALFSVFPPSKVEFKLIDGSLTGEIEICNEFEGKIAFRVMTNTREEYVVHPSSGFIPRGERALCAIVLKKDGHLDNYHTFMINGLKAEEEDIDRKLFWEKHKDAQVVVHKLGLKHPKLNDRILLDRLALQVRALKNEIRNAKDVIDRQSKTIKQLRETVECRHPSIFIIFFIAFTSIMGVMILINRGMHERFYTEAIQPLL